VARVASPANVDHHSGLAAYAWPPATTPVAENAEASCGASPRATAYGRRPARVASRRSGGSRVGSMPASVRLNASSRDRAISPAGVRGAGLVSRT
jgi:hypothetical protein